MTCRTTFCHASALLAVALLVPTATAQVRLVTVRTTAPATRTFESPDARAIIAAYANGHILTADKLYRGQGDAYTPVPVWTPEPAVITRSGQLQDGTWRIHLRTQSGIEGYVDLAHPKDLAHFLTRGTS